MKTENNFISDVSEKQPNSRLRKITMLVIAVLSLSYIIIQNTIIFHSISEVKTKLQSFDQIIMNEDSQIVFTKPISVRESSKRRLIQDDDIRNEVIITQETIQIQDYINNQYITINAHDQVIINDNILDLLAEADPCESTTLSELIIADDYGNQKIILNPSFITIDDISIHLQSSINTESKEIEISYAGIFITEGLIKIDEGMITIDENLLFSANELSVVDSSIKIKPSSSSSETIEISSAEGILMNGYELLVLDASSIPVISLSSSSLSLNGISLKINDISENNGIEASFTNGLELKDQEVSFFDSSNQVLTLSPSTGIVLFEAELTLKSADGSTELLKLSADEGLQFFDMDLSFIDFSESTIVLNKNNGISVYGSSAGLQLFDSYISISDVNNDVLVEIDCSNGIKLNQLPLSLLDSNSNERIVMDETLGIKVFSPSLSEYIHLDPTEGIKAQNLDLIIMEDNMEMVRIFHYYGINLHNSIIEVTESGVTRLLFDPFTGFTIRGVDLIFLDSIFTETMNIDSSAGMTFFEETEIKFHNGTHIITEINFDGILTNWITVLSKTLDDEYPYITISTSEIKIYQGFIYLKKFDGSTKQYFSYYQGIYIYGVSFFAKSGSGIYLYGGTFYAMNSDGSFTKVYTSSSGITLTDPSNYNAKYYLGYDSAKLRYTSGTISKYLQFT